MTVVESARAAFERCGIFQSSPGPLVVAVSGGVDSMVLLSVAVDLLGSELVVAASFDHQLRAESAGDLAMVGVYAAKLGCRFESGRGDVAAAVAAGGGSVEQVARRMRYEWLADVARARGAAVVVVGHHADDQAETVLFNLLRGGGLAAAGGMAETSTVPGAEDVSLLRPLLSVRRDDLVAFAAVHGVPFCDDASNQSLDFTRNRIRHEALPLLSELMERDVVPALIRHAEIARADEAFLESLAERELERLRRDAPEDAVEGSLALMVVGLRELDLALRARVALRWLAACGVPDVSRRDVLAVDEVAMATDRPAKVNVKAGLCVRRRAGMLFIAPQKSGDRSC
ncbi:tRNA lysidine(34) synthetase TilS [Sulfuriroseicoccus oceanibius]|uniref:tRNA(Ile)-lysidine synthase n=1 Tax=Sulfuriroseicoccus oceanibius TaxID=2707525 RepID=A0A6B3LA61_9BACT|nr:tRNA lysidine(34) synthetase TilS [Sulfuriroseicoccus oceanibius]QQL45400.1 tRNA lysidine(34) synthetase TilS [Sulfuriroseicoccus oceanibius]